MKNKILSILAGVILLVGLGVAPPASAANAFVKNTGLLPVTLVKDNGSRVTLYLNQSATQVRSVLLGPNQCLHFVSPYRPLFCAGAYSVQVYVSGWNNVRRYN